MPNLTTTTSAVFVPEIWLTEVRRALEAKLVVLQKFKSFPHEGRPGDILHVPDVSDLVANDMVQTGTVTPQAITETEFTITINKHKEASFRIAEFLRVQESFGLRNEYTQKAGFAIAKAMETDMANLFDVSYAGFNADGTSEASAGAAVTVAGINKARETLDLNNVPEDERVILVPPEGLSQLLGINQFTSIDYIDSKPTVTRRVGMIFGMEVIMSNLLPSRLLTTTKKQIIVAHKDAIVMAKQASPRIQSDFELANLATLVVVDAIYGVKQFRTTNAVRLRMNL